MCELSQKQALEVVEDFQRTIDGNWMQRPRLLQQTVILYVFCTITQ